MTQHLKHLQRHIPDLLNMDMLDIGCGRGKFMEEVIRGGGYIAGIEMNGIYIEEANVAPITQGVAEDLPFENKQFRFVNISETLEHVDFPEEVLKEAHRVLSRPGYGYLSVPNRYGMFDPHFKLWFLNWIPRRFCNLFIGMMRKHKVYTYNDGYQRLDEMHYYTYGQITHLLNQIGFKYEDIRLKQVKGLKKLLYLMIRPFYFNTFHFLLRK